MADVSGDYLIPMEESFSTRSKRKLESEGVLAGREVHVYSSATVSDTQIETAIVEIERLLETMHQASGLLEKRKALFQSRRHLSLLRSTLQDSGSLPDKRRRKGEAGEDLPFQSRVRGLIAQVHDADMALISETAQEEQAVRGDLQAACVNALGADDPVSVLAKALERAERFYDEDSRLMPILKDARLAVSAFQAYPLEAKRLLVPLFQKMLVEDLYAGGTCVLRGREMAAELVFLADCGELGTLPESFEEASTVLKEKVTEILQRQKQAVELMISEHRSSGCYDSQHVRNTLYPQAVAATLVRQDGTLNLGLISIVKSVFLSPKEKRDAMERHIASSLRELQSDETVVTALENFPLVTDPESVEDVNCLLQRPLDAPLSRGNVLQAVLKTFFTWWRQGGLGNCYLVVAGTMRRELATLWMIGDIQELLTRHRTLTRTVGGDLVTSVGLPCVAKQAVKRKMTGIALANVYHLPAVKYACELLGCTTEEEFKNICLKNPEQSLSLLDVFSQLCTLHSIPQEQFLRAVKVVESQSQNVFLRIWENAMGGFLSPPISPSHVPIQLFYPRRYFMALLTASLNHAKRLNLEDIVRKLEETLALCQPPYTAPLDLPPDAVPAGWRFLRGGLIPQAMEASSELSFAMLREDPTSGDMVPFRSAVELAEFLQRSFEQWVDDLGAFGRTYDHLEVAQRVPSKDFLADFEATLREKDLGGGDGDVAMIERGPLTDLQYYSMSGCYEFFNFLEQGELEVSGGTKEHFGDTVAEAIPRLFQWMEIFRQRHGTEEGLSISVCSIDHNFRFLPNHPSLLRWHEKGSEVRGLIEAETTKMLDRQLARGSLHKMTKKVLLSMSSKIIDINECMDVDCGDMCNEIVAATNKRLVRNMKPTVGEFVRAVLASVDEVCANHKTASGKTLSSSHLTALKYSLLSAIYPTYPHNALHFADVNYSTKISGKDESIDYALWFDPFTREWSVISVPESGQMFYNETGSMYFPVLELQAFFQPLLIQTLSQPVQRAITEKKLLVQERMRSKKLLQLEEKFVVAWGVMAEKIQKLSREGREHILEYIGTLDPIVEELSALDVAKRLVSSPIPQTLIEAGDLCLRIRDAYQKLLKEISLQAGPQHVVMHTIYAVPYAPTMQYLTEDDESFLRTIQDVLQTEPMQETL